MRSNDGEMPVRGCPTNVRAASTGEVRQSGDYLNKAAVNARTLCAYTSMRLLPSISWTANTGRLMRAKPRIAVELSKRVSIFCQAPDEPVTKPVITPQGHG